MNLSIEQAKLNAHKQVASEQNSDKDVLFTTIQLIKSYSPICAALSFNASNNDPVLLFSRLKALSDECAILIIGEFDAKDYSIKSIINEASLIASEIVASEWRRNQDIALVEKHVVNQMQVIASIVDQNLSIQAAVKQNYPATSDGSRLKMSMIKACGNIMSATEVLFSAIEYTKSKHSGITSTDAITKSEFQEGAFQHMVATARHLMADFNFDDENEFSQQISYQLLLNNCSHIMSSIIENKADEVFANGFSRISALDFEKIQIDFDVSIGRLQYQVDAVISKNKTTKMSRGI